jgi:phenylacetate-CoA ligase
MKIPGVLPQYRIIVNDNHGVKEMYIEVEAEPGVTGHQVVKQLREDLGFSPDGDVFPAGALPRQEGKAKRVIYQKDGVEI